MTKVNRFSIIDPAKSRFFYGYVIVLVGTLGVLASLPGQTVGVSVFTDPVKDALQLSRNQFSFAYMLGTFLSSLFLGRAGRWFDKYGARWVAFFAALALAFSLILCSLSVHISEFFKTLLNQNSFVIPFMVITILFFLIRFSGQGVLTMASRNMIMKWFDAHRGKANSFSSIVVSLGFSSAPLWISFWIDEYKWQNAWLLFAGVIFIFSIIILQFFRDTPEQHGLVPDGPLRKNTKTRTTTEGKKQFTVSEASKTRAFWMYALVISFHSFFITGFTFHVVSIFQSEGFTKADAIAIFLPSSIIAVTVSTLFNILSDYIKLKVYLYLMILGGILATTGLIFLSSPVGFPLIIIGTGILGGFFAILNAVLWPRFYGRKNLGAITGKVMGILVFASALAPILFSASYTYLGSYTFVGFISLLFLSFLLIGSSKANNPQ